MARVWSKLQKDLYNLIDRRIKLQIHAVAYERESYYGRTPSSPRWWITLGKEIIWDYPKGFKKSIPHLPSADCLCLHCVGRSMEEPFLSMSDLLREYVNTDIETIYEKPFEKDKWGLIPILMAADRRIGNRRLEELKSKTSNIAVIKIIEARLKIKGISLIYNKQNKL